MVLKKSTMLKFDKSFEFSWEFPFEIVKTHATTWPTHSLLIQMKWMYAKITSTNNCFFFISAYLFGIYNPFMSMCT